MDVDEPIRGTLVTVPADEPLVGCARRMTELRIRHLVVLGPGGEGLGVVTDDGVFSHGALVDDANGWIWFDGADASITARDVAVPADVVVEPQFDLGAALRRLAKSPRDFVLVSEAGIPKGLLTEHDLVRVAVAELAPNAALPMSSPVATVTPDTPASDALRLQVRLGFRHLVVAGADGRATGVVSRRDLLTAWPREAPVKDLTSGETLVAVPEGSPLAPVLTAMRDLHLGCIPVLNAHGAPVGVVTRRDVLQAVVSGLEEDALFG